MRGTERRNVNVSLNNTQGKRMMDVVNDIAKYNTVTKEKHYETHKIIESIIYKINNHQSATFNMKSIIL